MRVFPHVVMVIFLLAGQGYCAASPQPLDCANVVSCKKAEDDDFRLLRVTAFEGDVLKAYPPDGKSRLYRMTYSPNRKAFFIEPGLKHFQLFVANLAGKAIKLDVPGWEHRPLEARWLSDTALEVEMGFNPHAGMSWKVDILQGRAVSSEHCLEDVELAAKCAHGDDVVP